MRSNYLIRCYFFYPSLGVHHEDNIEIQNVTFSQVHVAFVALAFCFVNDKFFTHMDLFVEGSKGSFFDSLKKISTIHKSFLTHKGE